MVHNVSADLAVVIVLDPARGLDEMAATIASIRSETGDDARVCVLARTPGEMGSTVLGIPALGPGEALVGTELVAFIRPGDRWRQGSFVARRRPLVGHPDAVMSVAGHVIVTPDGSELETVRAPLPGSDPAELLLHPSIELSTVLVRTSALTPTALSLVARTGGDTVLWARLVREHGLLPSTELAAEIPVDRAICANDASVQRAALDAARALWEDETVNGASRLVDEELSGALAEKFRLNLEVMVRDAKIERLEAEARLRELSREPAG